MWIVQNIYKIAQNHKLLRQHTTQLISPLPTPLSQLPTPPTRLYFFDNLHINQEQEQIPSINFGTGFVVPYYQYLSYPKQHLRPQSLQHRLEGSGGAGICTNFRQKREVSCRGVSQSTREFCSSCLRTQTYFSLVWNLVVKK